MALNLWVRSVYVNRLRLCIGQPVDFGGGWYWRGRRRLSVAFSKVLLWIFKFSVGKGKEGLRGYGNWI